MATLETQYKNFLNDNPNSEITFEEWKRDILNSILNTIKSMDNNSDLLDWDSTLNDGLEND